jgi:hypothetical protein|tara:strand:- start:2303 stop:2683 length:381 start_codon:yes stop_codon:yes gene_type:complete
MMNKILICLSVILNGILLMLLLGILPFLLYLSILINLGFAWFIKNVLEREQRQEAEITEIVDKIEKFSEHLESVHELEMYYGDENLHSLMEHSTELINEFVDFQANFFDVEVEEIETEYYEKTSQN